mmetsp:Transcript_8992/g.21670  ORF Transcript_8992/g.21670 Transcript_8992/m.21670 type:complete len:242 (+) Transcript_8992:424-1149(+)
MSRISSVDPLSFALAAACNGNAPSTDGSVTDAFAAINKRTVFTSAAEAALNKGEGGRSFRNRFGIALPNSLPDPRTPSRPGGSLLDSLPDPWGCFPESRTPPNSIPDSLPDTLPDSLLDSLPPGLSSSKSSSNPVSAASVSAAPVSAAPVTMPVSVAPVSGSGSRTPSFSRKYAYSRNTGFRISSWAPSGPPITPNSPPTVRCASARSSSVCADSESVCSAIASNLTALSAERESPPNSKK